MRAMVLHKQAEQLQLCELPRPTAGPGQVLLQVKACGVCRTDLHVMDGEEFLPLAANIPITTGVHIYALERASAALDDLRHGRFNGAAVLVP